MKIVHHANKVYHSRENNELHKIMGKTVLQCVLIATDQACLAFQLGTLLFHQFFQLGCNLLTKILHKNQQNQIPTWLKKLPKNKFSTETKFK